MRNICFDCCCLYYVRMPQMILHSSNIDFDFVSICAYKQVLQNDQQMASVFPMARPQANLNEFKLVSSDV